MAILSYVHEIHKNYGTISRLCVSSLREGHANLLCIVPILTDVAEATAIRTFAGHG